jgi:D-3-phosphoglycerate dehydrogenase
MVRRILLGPSSFGELDPTPLTTLREGGCEVIENPVGRRLTKAELQGLLPGVDGLIAGLEPVDREVLENSQLRVISRCGSGISNVDVEAARELGIAFYYTPHGPTEAVAELTLGMILTLLRDVIRMDRAMHARTWQKRIGFQLAGKTVLIVGYGRIGRRLGQLLKPFDVRILVVDPAIKVGPEEVTMATLPEALPKADIISLHPSGETCILGEYEFQLFKSGVILLNGARGGLIDELQLRRALDAGTVRGAWLDCFDEEPYDGPLSEDPRVILTPHIGSYTLEGRLGMEMAAVENLLRGLP